MKKLFFTIAIMFAVVMSNAQIQADFTWTGAQCSGGTIVFTDASSVTPISYQWHIDGPGYTGVSLGSAPTFSHNFPPVSVPTDFQMSLYVTDSTFASSNITKTVTIYPLPAVTISPTNPTICQGGSEMLTASGSFPSYSWSTTDTTQAITVAPVVTTTYTVVVTDTNQCQNTASVLVTVNPTYFFPQTHTMCQGSSYSWQGTTYTSAGTYTASYQTSSGCDSIYELELTVHPIYMLQQTHEMCDGDTYSWQGNDYTQTGVYTASYNTIHGCDSIYELELTVHPLYEFITNESVCAGDSVQWRGQWYSTSGTYTQPFTTVNGCDSTYTLNLTVNPLPVNYLVQSIPSNGILSLSTTGTITISWSDLGVNYWVEKGSIHVTGNISGTGALLNLGTNYTAGTYDIWSANAAGCELKQGSITFVEDNGTTKIVGTPTYGDAFNSFIDGAVEMTLYFSTVDIFGNPVILVEDGPTATSSGNVEFDNLDAGDYYLRSQVIDTATYNTVVPIFFFDGPTVDSADIITIIDLQILSVNVNHPQYPDTTGSNTAGGVIDTLGGTKSGGIPNQIVILRNEVTGEILSAVISDHLGQYFMPHLPDNSELELYVTSFEYQNWVPAGISSTTNTHYTINFVVDGDMVYPEGWTGVTTLELFEFNIYPNPTTDFIYLENIPDGSLLQVFDLQGKLVVSDSRSHKSSLDVSSLPTGQYVIVVSHDGSVGTHKFIKQ